MIDPVDPARLVDSDGSAPEALRELLRGAARDVGTDAELARLGSRLGSMLAPATAAQVGLGIGTKLGLGALGLLAAGGGLWFFQSLPAAPVRSVTAPVTTATPSVAPQVAESAVPEPPLPSAQVAALPAPARAPAAPRASEAELLEQARGALGRDPSRALSRANEHARSYPRGVLVQEREVIAIQALRQLGRAAEADRRAQTFVKAFPGSAFQRRLDTAR